MVLACPRCSRTLTDTAGDAAFCMYCGQRLRDTDASPPPQSFGSNDVGATQAFTPTDTPAEQTAEPQLTRVGGYRLVRFIGAGGMGQVYEAEAEETGQRVAVKLLSGRLARSPQSVERFRQEGRVASQISHPNCVFVMRADADAGRPYLVMELMPGRTLKDEVDDHGPLPVQKAIARILDVIDGLAEAHRLGVIHRDVKPSNCFVTDNDRVKVGDFGLSKSLAADVDGQVTASGTFLGTVLYASPEQIRGDPVGYESDVYAVCGSLYHLLTGRAPYQHDSLTAALAKAVSEPAPSVRVRRPDVPKELDRIIRRGLDRDRANRFSSLDDLADALRALQPERAVPARRRLMVLAYLIDYFIVVLLLIPFELLRLAVFGRATGEFMVNLLEMTWPSLLLTVVYFILFEGLAGTTPGKNLLRLRVERPGESGPPGLKTAAIRTVVYNGNWWLMFTGPEFCFGWLPTVIGVPLGILVFLGCLAAVLRQFWKSPGGWRGVHDFAAGTRTVQRPQPAERVKLRSQYPVPFDHLPATGCALPSSIGGFVITGKLFDLPDGGEVWAAEDKGLGRRLVVRVCKPDDADPTDDVNEDIAPPFRVRSVGHGTIVWGGSERGWTAYAAPSGAPLVDLTAPRRPLPWAAARPVLEQVAEVAADDPTVRLDQVWVEPTGRVQVADFPLPTGSRRTGSGNPHPLRLLREAATALLEGNPRATGGPVKAPLPRHTDILFDELAAPDGDIRQVRRTLADTRSLPPQVTPGMRATQLGVQGLLLAPGLALLYSLGLFNLIVTILTSFQSTDPSHVHAMLADPTGRAVIESRVRLLDQGEADLRTDLLALISAGRIDQTLAELDQLAKRQQTRAEAARKPLNRLERTLVARMERVKSRQLEETDPEQISLREVQWMLRVARHPRRLEPTVEWYRLAVGFTWLPAIAMCGWVTFAVLFRGGLAMRLAGIVPVRADGRPAGRLWCGLREILVWAPLVALLLASLWLQYAFPSLVSLRTALWLLAILLLPVYVLLAMRRPARPPQDRLLGNWLMPA